MKKFLLTLALLTGLAAGRANAQTVCGPQGYGFGPTWDVTGKWAYTWPDGYDTGYMNIGDGVVLHGTLTLTSYGGYVAGELGVPVEITDPYVIAHWNVPVFGTQINESVMLYGPPSNGSGFDDPWWFELIQNGSLPQVNRHLGAMSGEEFGGAEHYDRNAKFSAVFNPGQAARGTVAGASTPCPSANPPVIGGDWFASFGTAPINYTYNWAGFWTGTVQLFQYGPWVFGQFLAPDQLTPAQKATWNWPFWGGILTTDGSLYLVSGPGWGYNDPWWFGEMPMVTWPHPYGAVESFSGPSYGYASHLYEGTFSAVRQ